MPKQRFRYSASILRNGHLVIGLASLLAIVAFSLVLLELPGLSELNFSELYLDEYGNTPVELQLFGAVLLVGCIVGWANRQIRVELDSETLTVHIPRLTGLGLMKLTTGNHRIPIHTIQKIELTPVTGFRNMAQAIQQSRLSLVTDRQTYRFQPYNFLEEGGPDHRMGLADAMRRPKTRVEALINEAPFVKALSALAGNADYTSAPTDRTGPLANQFNLLKHRGMVIQLVLLAGLGTYGLIDYLLLTNYLVVGGMPLWPFVSGGLLTAALGIRLGKGAPLAERFGLAALLSVVAVAAAYPGLQRYTLVASPIPVAITYNTIEPGYFQHAGYPVIDQRKSSITEYWQSLPAEEGYLFFLHKPVTGFALIDMAPVYEKSRAFYNP